MKGHQKMTIDFSGNIDVVYTNQGTEFETLSTHMKKLENQVVHTSEVVKRHKTLIKEKMKIGQRHHINTIGGDDFWKVLEEIRHQDKEIRENPEPYSHNHRSTAYVNHRSMVAVESREACEAINIDRQQDPTID